ncbi:MAG TPA: alkaline phosphatase family protein, partial [Bacteroidia bacterium]|nr:alkaline phosphatase family protein [Bacteroidia bacterium]
GILLDQSSPPASPLNDCNLGSSLIQAGYTFIGYAEDQPSPGWYKSDAGNYYTKHCPWVNWIGYGVPSPYDSIPLASDLPMFPVGTYYPDSLHYANLPTMAWVIPNSVNDMHDGSASSAIPNGDTWFKKNMMPLIRWAANPANNTVVLIIWDEDDYSSTSPSNHIPLLIYGGIVKGGNYNAAVNHYSTLRLMEEMFGITNYCGSSASASEYPSAIWRAAVGINSIAGTGNQVNTWPVPAKNECNIHIVSSAVDNANIGMYDISGRKIKNIQTELKPGGNDISISTVDVADGVYFLDILGEKINVTRKIVVAK